MQILHKVFDIYDTAKYGERGDILSFGVIQ